MPHLPNPKHELFCKAFVLEPVGARAAVAAGYSARTADETQRRILARADVQARIAELRSEVDEAFDQAFKVEAVDMLQRLHTIATADARDLTQYHIGACRYCHGIDHLYQWRTMREFRTALEAAKKSLPKGALEPDPADDPSWPDLAGGLGYQLTAAPNPSCPECDGLGQPYVTATDTDKLSPAAAMLFAGAKQGLHGIEILMQDRAKPLELVAKHLGIGKQAEDEGLGDSLARGLAEIAGRLAAAAPIRRGGPED